jgi:tRNA threonylcarbamoyladenosine biosynthesis protein TsaB
MKILAIETSHESGSVALLTPSSCRELSAQGAQTHSAWVLPTIAQLMDEAGLAISELDAIAFGAGPGAFTGLRLACGVAQGLAFATHRPVVAVGSLEALAWQAGEGLRVVAVDARMNELYVAAFRVAADSVEGLMPPECLPPLLAAQRLHSLLHSQPGVWSGAGNGFAAYDGLLHAELGAVLGGVDVDIKPTARAVGHLAAARFAAGHSLSPAQASPFYVRDKVARTSAERLASGGRA